MRTPDESFEAHARRRVSERYGVVLSPRDYYRLCEKVARHDRAHVRFVVRQTSRVTVHWVRWAGVELLCVYDAVYQRITTVLDPRVRFRRDGRQDWAANRAAGLLAGGAA